jgi:hypothetical protein
MAESQEGLRGDGTQIGTEQQKPRPDNERIASIAEENSVAPIASASEQAASDDAGGAATSALQGAGAGAGDGMAKTDVELPGQAPAVPVSSADSSQHVDGTLGTPTETIGPAAESESVVAQTSESSEDGAAVSGGPTTGERPGAAPVAAVRSQAERGAQPPVAAFPQPRQRARKVLVGVLLVLSCIGLLSSALTYWMNQTLLNTDRWIQVVGPLAQNPQVVAALSDYTADQAVQVLNVQQRVENVLPERADLLAGPITQQVHDFIQRAVVRGMDTPAFQRAWIRVNTALHKQIVAALRGESQYATISNNKLTLDLVPIIGQALHQIQEQGPGLIAKRVKLPDLSQGQSPQQARQELSQALGVNIPADFGQVVVLQSDQLAAAQQAVRLLDALVIILPLITLALLAATIWFSVNRRRTFIELGIGVVIVFVALRILIAYLQQRVIDSITTPVGHAVGQGVIPKALDSLVTITTWLFVLGFLVALAAYLVGRRQREWIASGYTQARGSAEELGRRLRD